ncbi:uncharacterized protein TNCV_1711621 [Trichonephila clavipes]|nr:uncharacterized protein TNCV_1711621 [Trichonephila clavipes]
MTTTGRRLPTLSNRSQDVKNVEEKEENVETWMACDAEDCGFQMLDDDEIVTCKKNPTLSTMKRMKTRTTQQRLK